MVNQYYKVVAWQPRAEDWRCWQVKKMSKPRRVVQVERSSKHDTVELAREEIESNEFGLITFQKNGLLDVFYDNPDAFWYNAQKTESFFGKKILVVRQGPDGRWGVWDAGPTKGFRRLHGTTKQTKTGALKHAGNKIGTGETYCGVLVMDANGNPQRFDPYNPAWKRITYEQLQRDPAASMLEVPPG